MQDGEIPTRTASSPIISFLLEIIDTTIKPGDDLYKMYEIPVFAEIVDFETEGGGKKK